MSVVRSCHVTERLLKIADGIFRQSSVQVQHEWIGITSQLRHDERHPLSHQARNKGNVIGPKFPSIKGFQIGTTG